MESGIHGMLLMKRVAVKLRNSASLFFLLHLSAKINIKPCSTDLHPGQIIILSQRSLTGSCFPDMMLPE